MKKTLPFAVAAVLAAPALSLAEPCVVGTLKSYIDLGAKGCNVDAVHFASFTYRMTIPGVPADKVEVRPFSATTTGGVSILKFTGLWHAVARQRVEAVIGYNVRLPITFSPLPERGRLTLDLGPDRIDGAVGSIEVGEKTEVGTLLVYDRRGPFSMKRNDRLDFTPPGRLQTSEAHVAVAGGDAGATASYFASGYGLVRFTTTP